MSPITEAQGSRLFLSLNVQKSSSDVPNKLIKIATEPVLKPPAHIYNHSITTGKGLLVLFSAFTGGNQFKSQLLPFTLVTTGK